MSKKSHRTNQDRSAGKQQRDGHHSHKTRRGDHSMSDHDAGNKPGTHEPRKIGRDQNPDEGK